jgi:hypothetical protein
MLDSFAQSRQCDSCEALMINGVFCHEQGCPNQHKVWDPDRQEWIKYVECRECGCTIEAGDVCICQMTEEMEID